MVLAGIRRQGTRLPQLANSDPTDGQRVGPRGSPSTRDSHATGPALGNHAALPKGHRLFLPALTAARYNADIRALYQRLIAAGKPKMSATAAAMRKLVQIAFGVFKHQRPYQPHSA